MTRKQTYQATLDRELADLARLRADYNWHLAHSPTDDLRQSYQSALTWRLQRIHNVKQAIAEID